MVENEKTDSRAAIIADRGVITTRAFPASRELAFEAFANPALLAQWWGPAGFTNRIEQFDLRPGGPWHITMRSPQGAEYPNESEFVEIVRPAKIVFHHLRPMHWFEMTMRFDEQGAGTRVTWEMIFETPAECAKVKPFVIPANEENFDRLGQCLQALQNKNP